MLAIYYLGHILSWPHTILVIYYFGHIILATYYVGHILSWSHIYLGQILYWPHIILFWPHKTHIDTKAHASDHLDKVLLPAASSHKIKQFSLDHEGPVNNHLELQMNA